MLNFAVSFSLVKRRCSKYLYKFNLINVDELRVYNRLWQSFLS